MSLENYIDYGEGIFHEKGELKKLDDLQILVNLSKPKKLS